MPEKMTPDELQGILAVHLDTPFSGGEVEEKREQLMKRFFAEPYGDEQEGLSQVVDTSVRDVVYWAEPELIDILRSNYGVDPGLYAVTAYLEAMVLAAGIEQLEGRTDDKAALMVAMRGLTLADSPRGLVRLDELGNAVGNIYILEVQRRDGRLVNTPIKTYENVSQFWTYDPEEFLAQPVYSRDYPPARYAR